MSDELLKERSFRLGKGTSSCQSFVVVEAEASIQRHGPSQYRLALQGGLRFGLVSVGVFLFWAVAGGWLNRQSGELGFYSACALLFILLIGLREEG